MHVLQKPSHQSKVLYMALFSRAQFQKTEIKIKKKRNEPRAADAKQWAKIYVFVLTWSSLQKFPLFPKSKIKLRWLSIYAHTYTQWCVGVNWISLCILRLIFQYLVLVLCLSSPRFKCAHRERERNTHRIAVGLVTHHKVWESNLFRSLVAFLFVDLFHRGNFSRRLGWNSMTYSDISRGVIFFSDKFQLGTLISTAVWHDSRLHILMTIIIS